MANRLTLAKKGMKAGCSLIVGLAVLYREHSVTLYWLNLLLRVLKNNNELKAVHYIKTTSDFIYNIQKQH